MEGSEKHVVWAAYEKTGCEDCRLEVLEKAERSHYEPAGHKEADLHVSLYDMAICKYNVDYCVF